MNESKAQSAAFLTLTGLLVLAWAAALAYSLPVAKSAAQAESSKLVGESTGASQAEQHANFYLATRLDPDNLAAKLGLARAQLTAWDSAGAAETLASAGQGSEASELRLRTDIELGRTDPAAGLATLIGPQTSPEASGRLARAKAGKLPLAEELYADGLPESSSAILLREPSSFERDLLLGRLNYDRHTQPSLTLAASYLDKAVTASPADIAAHRLYAAVLKDLQRPAEAARQTDLADRLETGRP